MQSGVGARIGEMVTVAVDVAPLYGPRTGVALAVAGLVAALRALEDPPELVPYLTSYRARPTDGTRRLPYPAALTLRTWPRSSLPPADRFLRPAQVVHGTNYTVPPGRLPRLVSVYDCWFLRHEHLAVPDVRRAGRVLRRSIDKGAVVHCTSAATAGHLAQLFPGARIETIPLGPPPALPDPGDGSRSAPAPIPELVGASFVLALGTVERRKNLPALVAAWGELAPRHAALWLVLAGSPGDDSPALDQALDAIGGAASRRVLRPGRVDDATKAWLLTNAAALAYPSLDEGFGFPLLEAMAAGTPVVATSVGSIPEVAGDAAILCAPDDVAGLADALHRVLTDADERERLLAAGRRRLQAFDWETTALAMSALYRDLAGERAVAR